MNSEPTTTAAPVHRFVMPRRWSELPRNEQKSHYWAAIPDDPDSILDGWEYEIVYVCFDGKWCVYRMGEQKREPLSAFRFLFMIDLPELPDSSA